MHKSKNIVHINTKAKRSQTSCFQEVWPFYSLTSVKDGALTLTSFYMVMWETSNAFSFLACAATLSPRSV